MQIYFVIFFTIFESCVGAHRLSRRSVHRYSVVHVKLAVGIAGSVAFTPGPPYRMNRGVSRDAVAAGDIFFRGFKGNTYLAR